MNPKHLLRASILCAALALSAKGSHAQPKLDQNPPADTENIVPIEPVQTARIPLRNIASNLAAYWLDAVHQPMPMPIQASQRNSGNLFNMGIELKPQPGNGNGPSGLRLPEGIGSLVSIDPQNVLWVKGNKKGIEALQKLVEALDVPLNQIEIEAQIWEMSPVTLTSLPLVFHDGTERVGVGKSIPKPGGKPDFLSRVALALPTSNIAPTTEILLAGAKDGSAHLLAEPRVNVIDGLVATAQVNEVRSLVFGENTGVGSQGKPKNSEATPPIDKTALSEGFAFVNGQTSLTVRPILHGDALSLIFSITLDNNITQAATTLRDGQTLAVRLPNVNAANDWSRVALIQAKIVPHLGNVAPASTTK